MNWNVILPSSLGMPMPRCISVKMIDAHVYNGKEDSPMFEFCRMKLLRHVSFVDCPGHDILMATMLNGAAIMDGALLLIVANESCAQPQTSEHLAALEVMQLKHIIILQKKLILFRKMSPSTIMIRASLRELLQMIVIRSFDVNKPGSEVVEIKGGIAGGSILEGVLKVNQYIEVHPGIVVKDENDNIKCNPIYSRIVSLYAEQNELQFAVPGGLIGVGTTMDPTLARADWLVGQVLGEFGSLPEVYVELEVNVFLLRRLLGMRTKDAERQGKAMKLAKA